MPLTASQRLKLKREISEKLAPEGWAIIDATLREFGIPTSNTWDSGPPRDYILQMMTNASDEKLIDLAEHLGHQPEQAASSAVDTPVPEPSFWPKGAFRLFITHLAKHKTFASVLKSELEAYGISGFVAHSDIEPTLEWQDQIESALGTCEALVALLHEDFHESNWTDQEIGFAMGRGVPVSAVSLGQTPYGFIGRFQAFPGASKSVATLARELFDSYRKNKQTQSKMADVVVSLFEGSGSFAEAKKHAGWLEELTVWEPSFASRIRAAVRDNSQVSGSFGVPERVEKLAKKCAK